MEPVRRRLLVAAACAAMAPVCPASPAASPARMRRVVLAGSLPPASRAKSFRTNWIQWFTDNGFVQGRNLDLKFVDLEGVREHEVEGVAREVVATRPDVIITIGTFATRVFQGVTSEVPIVFYRVGDPVGAGLVNSLVRPGANLTGLSNRHFELGAKRLELLKEIAPKARRVAIVGEKWVLQRSGPALQAAAGRLGLTLESVVLSVPSPPSQVIAKAIRDAKVDSAIFDADGADTELLAELARLRIPIVYIDNIAVEMGGLVSLGERVPGPGRTAAAVAARVLRGESPATIPVQEMSIMHVTLNLRTARQIGIAVPASVRLRADQVFE